MKYRNRKFAYILAATLLLTGCGRAQETFCNLPVNENQKLILYTSHKEEVYAPIVREFEERTGIWVQVKSGGTTELLDIIAQEDGKQTCDVMFGGGVESYEAYSQYFEPYTSTQSEELDKTFCSKEGNWTVFSELPIVIIYNNKLVSEKEAPKGWQELLGGNWLGEIAFADPGSSGTSCTALLAMCQVLNLTPEELMIGLEKALAGNVSPDSKSVIDEVNEGKRLVGITLEEAAMKAINRGADLSIIYPSEGTSSIPDGSALVKNAPHPENARLFIDFTVSRDVQKIVEEQFLRRTVRLDLDIKPKQQKETLKTIPFDLEWASDNQMILLESWQRHIGQEKQQ